MRYRQAGPHVVDRRFFGIGKRAMLLSRSDLYWGIRKSCRDSKVVRAFLVSFLRATPATRDGSSVFAGLLRSNLRQSGRTRDDVYDEIDQHLVTIGKRALWDGRSDLYCTMRKLCRDAKVIAQVMAWLVRWLPEHPPVPFETKFRLDPTAPEVSTAAPVGPSVVSERDGFSLQFEGTRYSEVR